MVDSENTTATQCYNISVDFQAVGFCDLFGQSCDSVHLWTQLSKGNKSDRVSIIEDSAQVVVMVPDQCSKCSTPTQSDNETTTPTVTPSDNGQTVTQSDNGQTVTQSDRQSIVITASVLSVVVAIAVAALMMMIIFYYRKTRILVTKNNTEE